VYNNKIQVPNILYSAYPAGYAPYSWRYAQLKKKPTAQIAHLVFADTKANAEKTKRAVFCHRSTDN
jgi:hypothetical protein